MFKKITGPKETVRNSPPEQKKMGFNASWSMAVGGMVGGGIFSVLGVVVHTAGQWAWRLWENAPYSLAGIAAVVLAAGAARPLIKKW